MLVEKFGVVAIPVTADGRVLAVHDKQRENGHKMEKLGWDIKGEKEPVKGKRQFPGGVNDKEDEVVAIMREIREETNMSVSAAEIVSMGVSTLIDHERRGKADLYGVAIYLWVISGDIERELIREGAVEVAGDDLSGLRKRDQIVAQIFREGKS